MATVRATQGTFWRQFRLLLAAGLVGVAGLVPLTITQLAQPPANLPLPAPALAAVTLLQSSALVAGAVAVGVALAPRLGLRSLIAERSTGGPPLLQALRPALPLAAGLGLTAGAAIIALDWALRPWMPPAFLAATQRTSGGLSTLLSGLLYGGIAEELLLRWGLMSLVAWLGWRVTQGGTGRPTPAVMWMAIATAALLFGVGHLPAAATLAPLTPVFVARTVVLNSIVGVAAGWLYWRRDLEAAMVAHMAVHVAFALARVFGFTA